MITLYMNPVSNTSRPVRLLIMEHRLPVEEVTIDFSTGEHAREPYVSLNPNAQVPTLVDDGFVLTESSAMMKYLAEKFSLPVYPAGLRERARVNELMDWFNTGFYRDYAYNVVYPQIYPHHVRPSRDVQAGTIEWGKTHTHKWLKVLDTHWLGRGNRYLAGDMLTIADMFGAALLTCGHVTRDEFSAYPNIDAWLKEMAKLPNWEPINQAVEGFRAAVQDRQFVNV
jgi:glutathione S-transferase